MRFFARFLWCFKCLSNLLPCALVLLAACGQVDTIADRVPRVWPSQIGGSRPAPVFLPADVAGDEKLTLVIMLHGYGANGSVQDFIFGLEDKVESRRFVLIRPEGTKNFEGKQFWHATDVCCDFDAQNIDDVAYISALAQEAVASLPVDPDRISLVGHSNGGYMSYRMMCDKPELFHGIAVLAGSVYLDPADCARPGAIRLMHIHGTADATVPYDNTAEGVFRESGTVRTVGAEAAVDRWAQRGGCDATPVTSSTVDFLDNIEGAETEKIEYKNCDPSAEVTLYRVNDGDHLFLNVTDIFRDTITDFLLAP